jgi:hypothetical protein
VGTVLKRCKLFQLCLVGSPKPFPVNSEEVGITGESCGINFFMTYVYVLNEDGVTFMQTCPALTQDYA